MQLEDCSYIFLNFKCCGIEPLALHSCVQNTHCPFEDWQIDIFIKAKTYFFYCQYQKFDFATLRSTVIPFGVMICKDDFTSDRISSWLCRQTAGGRTGPPIQGGAAPRTTSTSYQRSCCICCCCASHNVPLICRTFFTKGNVKTVVHTSKRVSASWVEAGLQLLVCLLTSSDSCLNGFGSL